MTQAGYDVQVAVMFEDIKKPPVHIISEIRKGSEVYSCDFMTGNFWNKSIKELATNKNLVKSYWNKRWVKGLDHLLLKTEASAMSYRKVNQELHKYLSRDNNKNIPIIGLDPYKKMEEYIRTYYPNYTNSSKLSFILGIEPFTMIKNSKSFPKKWLTEKKK